MSKQNNLQNSLKRAFDDFEAPLKEAQWQRLEGELGGLNKTKKWRFFPYYFIAVLLLLVGSGILSYFIIYKNNNFDSSKYSINKNYKFESQQNSSNENLTKQQIDKNKNLFETQKGSIDLNSKLNAHNSDTSFKQRNKVLLKNNKNIILSEVNKIDDEKNETKHSKENEKIEVKDTNIAITNDTLIDNEDIVITDDSKNEGKSEFDKTEDLKNKKQDSTQIVKPREIKNKSKAKYVLSLSTGYSNMNVKVTSIENISKVHKDTRKIFEMSNQNTKTLFINFGFDCNVFKGFNVGLNTGFQYLHISQPVNFEYRMFEIPFYDIDRNIIGYIRKDSATADLFKSTTTNKTSFIKIPLRFNYSIPLNLKNEVLITAGTNISTVISARGNVISINEGKVKPLSRQMYGKLNFGFLGGMQYSRKLKNNWWIGVENDWQINRELFKNGPEKIKNRLSGYNFNLILKYKIY
ncbi:MAG: hypothetical protein HUU47_06460 [Bacteroidetes bacterium]|nr:hypothetical protein [Bacteroidota bacterium]